MNFQPTIVAMRGKSPKLIVSQPGLSDVSIDISWRILWFRADVLVISCRPELNTKQAVNFSLDATRETVLFPCPHTVPLLREA